MKRSSKWDEKAIENQLKKMPKIEDKQSKEALYARIQEKLQEDQLKPQKRKSWVFPTISSVAVFFLLLLIVPSFLNNNEQNLTLDKVEDNADMLMETSEYPIEEEQDMARTESTPNRLVTDESINDNYFGAVQPNEERELDDALVTIAVPVSFATGEFLLPVTIQGQGLSMLDRFMDVKNSFNGEYWGIGSFPPIQINSISEEKTGVVTIDVPTGSLESLSSTEDSLYMLALKETVSSLGYDQILFTSDGEPGVVWGQQGPLEKLAITDVNRGYYLFESNTGHQFLIKGRLVEAPGSNEEEFSFHETLELMKSGDIEKGYFASIPEEVVITNIVQTEDKATITFAEGVIVEDKREYLIMLEAIMFTAKDFAIEYIEFEGITLDKIGPYKLGDRIEIPDFINFIR